MHHALWRQQQQQVDLPENQALRVEEGGMGQKIDMEVGEAVGEVVLVVLALAQLRVVKDGVVQTERQVEEVPIGNWEVPERVVVGKGQLPCLK